MTTRSLTIRQVICRLHRARSRRLCRAVAIGRVTKLHNPFLRQCAIWYISNLTPGMTMISSLNQCRFHRFWRSRFGFVITVSGVTQLRKAFLCQCSIRVVSRMFVFIQLRIDVIPCCQHNTGINGECYRSRVGHFHNETNANLLTAAAG